MNEDIVFEIRSLADLRSKTSLGRIGRALEEDVVLRPELIGSREPLRKKPQSLEAHLLAWQPSITPGDYHMQLMQSGDDPWLLGQLTVMGDHPSIPNVLSFSYTEPLPVSLDTLAGHFRRLCEAMDAYYGMASYTPMLRQRMDLLMAARSGGTMSASELTDATYRPDEHALDDIYWLNFFGPAYLDHWGPDRLAGAGVRRERTANGGLIVWATETPYTFDPSADGLMDYPWKRPFYDALGIDAITHDTWQDPGPGVRVPSYEDHRLVGDRSP